MFMPAKALKILLVEDNPGDQELVRSYLTSSMDRPVELRCVTSLSAARSAVDSVECDLVLLDLGLPDADGLEVVGALRRVADDVPIVVLTGSSDEGAGEEALAMDAQDYLRKDQLDGASLGRSVRYALARSQWQQQYRQQLSASPDGMLVLDERGEVRFVNRAGEALLQTVPQSIDELPGAVRLARAAPMDVTLESGRIVEVRSVGTDWQGQPAQLITLRDITDRRAAERALARLTAELREANERLAALVSTDPLTEVLNRRGMEDALGHELDRADRSGDQIVGILVDFDDFKSVNDRFGHAVGDAALKALTNAILSALRGGDHVGRVGGDEFLVILSDATLAEGLTVAEKLRRTVASSTLPVADGTIKLSASFGVGVLETNMVTIEQVLAALGTALKRSKIGGKDRVTVTPTAGGAVHDEAEPLDDSPLDPEAVELHVALQPIRRTDAPETVGSEALTRGPPGGLEMPGDLFRAAFEQDVLTALDLRALRHNLVSMQASGVPGIRHVNLFPSTLLNTPIDRLLRLIGEEVELDRVCIELSEQQFLGDPTYLREPLRQLRAKGIRIAIDDVGFGRSSIEALLVLEPDVIKVDRHCVQGIERGTGERRQLERLIAMLGAMSADVIVEGVESQAELLVLQEMGVRYAQGFYWGRPTRMSANGAA